MWKTLKERYTVNNPTSRVQLQTELHQLQYGSTIKMSEFIDKVEGIFNQLKVVGSPIYENLKGPIILAMFCNSDESPYGPVVAALQTLGDERLTWETVTARFLLKYNSRNRNTVTSVSSVKPKMEGKKSVLKDMARVRCFGCHKFGHCKRN